MFDVLQLFGGLILAMGYLPQIAQIIRTKSCKDLNLKAYLLVLLGIALMEIYAVDLALHDSGQMFLVTNSLSLLITGLLCGMILKYRRVHHGERRGH
jgi:MtN3 and saliva related transmembrane protein